MKIVGICGSLRTKSVNMGLLRAAATIAPKGIEVKILSIQDIPMYNGDLESNSGLPQRVVDLSAEISQADAVLFSVPEYNYALPSALKNVIDWVSRNPENPWKNKPVAVMGAGGGSGGSKAAMNFRQSALFNQMLVLNRPHVYVNAFRSFNRETGDLTNDQVQGQIKDLLQQLEKWTALHQKEPSHTGLLRVVGFSGSLRTTSTNTGLLRAAGKLLPDQMELEILSIDQLPIYTATGSISQPVKEFVTKLNSADAILFANPEYNFSMTGVMKNALEWGGRWNVFDGKPALIVGSGGGFGTMRSQGHLRQAGIDLNIHFLSNPLVFIPAFEKGNFDLSSGELLSEKWKERLSQALLTFVQWSRRLAPAIKRIDNLDLNLTVASPPVENINVVDSAINASWTQGKKKIVLLNGSIESNAPENDLAKAISEIEIENVEFKTAPIDQIPLYNGDTEKQAGIPIAVQNLANLIKSADMIVFSMSESHFGVTGALKNAIDWTSRIPDVYKGKAAAIVNISTGVIGHDVHAGHHIRQIGVFLDLHFINKNGVRVTADSVDTPATKDRLEKMIQTLLQHSERINRSVESSSDVKILLVPGSIRQTSANMGLIRTAMSHKVNHVVLELADVSEIPMYNQDTENEKFPESAEKFVNQVKAADAVIFVSPEYNFNFTPLIKNAIDWASRRDAFEQKPGAIMGSGGGVGSTRSHDQLRYQCVFLDVHLLNTPSVAIKEFEPSTTDFATGDLLDEEKKERIYKLLETLRDFTRKFMH